MTELVQLRTWADINSCVGCGFCCASQPCPLAYIGGWWQDGQCALIEWDGACYRCKFVNFCNIAGFPDVPAGLLGIGRGCDGEEGCASWRLNIRQRSHAEAQEIRASAEYEDEPANDLLDLFCGGDANTRLALEALITEMNRLFGRSFITKLEAERFTEEMFGTKLGTKRPEEKMTGSEPGLTE